MASFKVLDKILAPALDIDGNPKSFSEDALYVADGIAALFDGATGVSERRVLKTMSSDPEWLANKAADALAKVSDISVSPREIVKSVITRVRAEYEKDALFTDIRDYEKPSSTMVMVKQSPVADALDLVLIADGIIMWDAADGGFGCVEPSEFLTRQGEELEARVAEVATLGMRLARQKMLPELQRVRALMNKPEGYGVLSPDYEVLRHKDFKVTVKKFKKGDRILISSDGLLRYADEYKLGSRRDFFAAAEKSLTDLLKTVRDFERSDLSCEKLPRFKVSDDVSAVLVEVV